MSDNYTPGLRNKRRSKPRPYNHSKKVSKNSPFSRMRKKNRGQG
jgi:hypothetical protein